MKYEVRSTKYEKRKGRRKNGLLISEREHIEEKGLMERKRDLPERTFAFALRIVELCKVLEREHGAMRVLSHQLLRSGTSIGANVEEGQAGQSKADFISKYAIALKEARETHYWLRLLAADLSVPTAQLQPLLDECNQLISILTTIIKKAKMKFE